VSEAQRAHLIGTAGGGGVVGGGRSADRGLTSVHRVKKSGPGGDSGGTVLAKVVAGHVVESASGTRGLVVGRRRAVGMLLLLLLLSWSGSRAGLTFERLSL